MTTKAYAYLSDEKVVDFELSIRRLLSSTRLKTVPFRQTIVPVKSVNLPREPQEMRNNNACCF